MSDILKKLLRADLRRLTQGAWVAWSASNWGQPGEPDFAYHEAQVMTDAVRTSQYVTVLFNGLPREVAKNQLYKLLPVIAIEDMHQQFDYNA
jgi:hypothetical protein